MSRLPAGTSGARWEEFAKSGALCYIDPTLGHGVSADEFIEGGRAVVERELDWAGPLCAYKNALEIGCGVGRNTVHLARHFTQLDGVDVSPTMVRFAQDYGLPENVRLHVLSGRDLDAFDDRSFDFVFSHLVFQHINEEAAIQTYLHEIARVLRLGAVAVLQFDTRHASLPAALMQKLPDALLPRVRRRGIRRHRRPAAQIREFGRAAGLTLEAERDPDTAEHWFCWRLDERSISGPTT